MKRSKFSEQQIAFILRQAEEYPQAPVMALRPVSPCDVTELVAKRAPSELELVTSLQVRQESSIDQPQSIG